MKTVSRQKPDFISFNIINGYILNAFIKTIDVDVYEYTSAIVGGTLSYDVMISELINAKYTSDQVTAITLNYLLTLHEEVLEPEKVKEYQQDYKELQEYRAACKAEAKRAIEYVKEN